LGEVLISALPSDLRAENQRLVVCRLDSFASSVGIEGEVFAEVKKRGRIQVRMLARAFSGRNFYRVLSRLVSEGAVGIEERLKRGPREDKKRGATERAGPSPVPCPKLTLTAEQETALQSMQDTLREGGFETFLLMGVTGSGKTEIYIRAMEQVWQRRRCSLILVPEIALTPQLLDRLEERFPGMVGRLHSGLTQAERLNQWWRIARGEVAVVVGARSAVFAPVPDLGLIIVDEEHDPSYKQDEGVRYHARDLAVVRGSLVGCPVLLGSATPSVESFQNVRDRRYRLLELTERVESRRLPRVEIVDLRSEGRDGGADGKLFSARLVEALQANHERGHQSLIFLNRRGFANFLQCNLCGFVVRCPHCSISLTFHFKEKSVFCHHCGFSKPAGDLCSGCGNMTLGGIGSGTEKIEQELCRLIPEAKIGRMDRDTTTKRGSQEKMLRQWERGEIEILVGTQMITKGHDVGGVTLVGVILADLSLNVPDFRAGERTFQLLSQVAGRAGRGTSPGRVVVQTFVPDHYSFEYAATHDYRGFFESEMEFRKALNYPPLSRLAHLRLEGTVSKEVERNAGLLGQSLRRCLGTSKRAEEIEVLGPAPAPIAKLRNRYRWQILLKGRKGSNLRELAYRARDLVPRRRTVRLYIDVDPYNML
jgi:primosomal protein N' (replication factor Y)